jgi:hypothetical protein
MLQRYVLFFNTKMFIPVKLEGGGHTTLVKFLYDV